MKTLFYAAFAAATAFAATAAQADTLIYNSDPADTWYRGTGNEYAPPTTAVLTSDDNQLYLRWHKTFEAAPTSTGSVYSFALGTFPLSFDWGVDGGAATSDLAGLAATITLTDLRTGGVASFDPFATPDNQFQSGSVQNSARLNWFLPFDPNIDNTYRLTLAVAGLEGGSRSLSVDAQLGAGAPPVPEPATWAMMIAGFGLVGGAMRRTSRKVSVTYA